MLKFQPFFSALLYYTWFISAELVKGRIGGFKGDNFVLQGTQAVLLVLIQNVVDVPRIGNAARDIPVETQMLLLEATANSSMHALLWQFSILHPTIASD